MATKDGRTYGEERIHEEATPNGLLVVTARIWEDDDMAGTPFVRVELGGKVVADDIPKARPSAGAVISVGRVDFAAARGEAIKAAFDRFFDRHRAGIEGRRRTLDAAARARHEQSGEAAAIAGAGGGEADIEANYEGGLAAFRRGADREIDRTPRYKGAAY